MPGGRPYNLQWRNHNSMRSYPLSEAAGKRDVGNTISIPDSLIVGLQLGIVVGINAQPDKFFLRKLIVSPVGFTIVIAYDDGVTYPLVASAQVTVATHYENKTYDLGFQGDFDDCDGDVIVGPLTDALELPSGEFLFDPANGRIDPDAVRPQIRSISSLTIVNGGDRSKRLYGDITLRAGTNFRITATTGEEPVITLGAVAGEGLNEDCICNNADTAPCIRTINGIPPTDTGDFTFVGANCVTIEPGVHLLTFRDECSKPCCGCQELDAIKEQINNFATEKLRLEGLANRVAAESGSMSLIVLGSRISDSGCDQC
jgi:hypothetical protein